MFSYINVLKWAAIVAFSVAVGWTTNGWRLGKQIEAMRVEAKQAELDATAAARAREKKLNQKLQEAQDAATIRERAMRADAARARSAADRLRDELATIHRDLPGLAADACRVRVDTLAELFLSCTAAYRDVAEQADRHVNDKQSLIDSWPK